MKVKTESHPVNRRAYAGDTEREARIRALAERVFLGSIDVAALLRAAHNDRESFRLQVEQAGVVARASIDVAEAFELIWEQR